MDIVKEKEYFDAVDKNLEINTKALVKAGLPDGIEADDLRGLKRSKLKGRAETL